jgi:hypothetical protein
MPHPNATSTGRNRQRIRGARSAIQHHHYYRDAHSWLPPPQSHPHRPQDGDTGSEWNQRNGTFDLTRHAFQILYEFQELAFRRRCIPVPVWCHHWYCDQQHCIDQMKHTTTPSWFNLTTLPSPLTSDPSRQFRRSTLPTDWCAPT